MKLPYDLTWVIRAASRASQVPDLQGCDRRASFQGTNLSRRRARRQPPAASLAAQSALRALLTGDLAAKSEPSGPDSCR